VAPRRAMAVGESTPPPDGVRSERHPAKR